MARTLALRPRRIRQRGRGAEADDEHLTGESQSFKDYLLNGPDLSELDLSRDRSPMREVILE